MQNQQLDTETKNEKAESEMIDYFPEFDFYYWLGIDYSQTYIDDLEHLNTPVEFDLEDGTTIIVNKNKKQRRKRRRKCSFSE